MLDYNKEFIIVGYSGHSYVILETIFLLGLKIKGYLELEVKNQNPYEINYLGKESEINISGIENYFFVAIGDNHKRREKATKLRSQKILTPNLIHPSSSLSKNIELGIGNFIARNVAVNDFCSFKDDVIINTGAIIDHGCLISSAVHIGPGSVLCGDVKVGENTFIGARTVVKEGIKIGKNVIIGAGSVVINDVPDGRIIYGNPAK